MITLGMLQYTLRASYLEQRDDKEINRTSREDGGVEDSTIIDMIAVIDCLKCVIPRYYQL